MLTEEKSRKKTKMERREGKRKKERKDGGRESKAVFLNGATDLFQLD